MNTKKRGFKQWVCLSFLISALIGCARVDEADSSVAPRAYPDGDMAFYKKDTNGSVPGSCNQIRFVTGATKLKSVNGCGDNEVYFFALKSVPSAATFILCSDGANEDTEAGIYNKCLATGAGLNDSDWYFELKTTKVTTDTIAYRISDLRGISSGQMVQAGVMMVRNGYRKGNIDGKLSAVIIERSALP